MSTYKPEGEWSATTARTLAKTKCRPVVACIESDCWVIYPPNVISLVQGGYSTAQKALSVCSRLWRAEPIVVEQAVKNPPVVTTGKGRPRKADGTFKTLQEAIK